MPLQVIFYDGDVYTSDIIRAINYAIQKKVDLINICIGGSFSNIENEAIQNAINQGIIVVASAGNEGNNLYNYPASYDNVISVGSTAPNGIISSFSNYNDKVDLVAPGEAIYTANTDGSYDYVSGTSYSAPTVSGIVAIIKAMNPSISPLQVQYLLTSTATDLGQIGKDNFYGYGLVNAFSAVNKLLEPSDLNMDGVISTNDIKSLASSYGSNLGNGQYNPANDLNKDAVVDLYDLVFVARKITRK